MLVVLSLIGGGIASAWLFEQHQGATVRVQGADFKLFKDAECTIPLTLQDTLSFTVRPGQTSASVWVYGKNMGDDNLLPQINVEGLSAGLTLLNVVGGGGVTPYPGWGNWLNDMAPGVVVAAEFAITADAGATIGNTNFFINVKVTVK
jgi:hypothetical protein